MSVGPSVAFDQTTFDRRMMRIALSAARRGLGTTAPNPSVGAVVVDPVSHNVISIGWTQPGGRPHAETTALEQAGARARGATIYVTLEPCSHYGKTAPCADAVIAADIARCVTAIEDPDPRVAGRGHDKLRAAGITVTRGVLAEAAHWLTRGHIVRVTERRPFIQLKMALGTDGEIARGTGVAPVWVTGATARRQGHLLRAETDAILVGRGTVADDDPELTCRLPGLAHRSPLRVVLASRADLPLTSKLVRTAGEVPVWVFCGAAAGEAKVAALEAAGVRVTRITSVGGELWLPAVTEALAGAGVTRLLVEGGPSIWRAFARLGLVDEIVLFRARPTSKALDPSAELAAILQRYAGGRHFDLVRLRRLRSDDMLSLRPFSARALSSRG